MGFWSMNSNFGNIVASSICNVLQNNGISWVYNFYTTGFLALVVAALIFFILKEKPD
jgi:sugar phosphate permease